MTVQPSVLPDVKTFAIMSDNQQKDSKLYAIYRKVENMVCALEKRRQEGHAPTNHIADVLFKAANHIRALDGLVKRGEDIRKWNAEGWGDEDWGS